MVVEPTWEREIDRSRSFFDSYPGAGSAVVIGLDEVGRGAIAGPVTVGAAAVRLERAADASLAPQSLPSGIRDSKLLSPKRREALYAALRGSDGAVKAAVGSASAQEIDAHGISAALTLAANRALDALRSQVSEPIAAVILDGNLDYLTRGLTAPLEFPLDVVIKGDQTCVSVACASIVAKVERDRHMLALHEISPLYGWDGNKGYGSAAHKRALAEHGLHPEHRASWNLMPAATQGTFDDLLAG